MQTPKTPEVEARAAHKPRRLLPPGRHRATVLEVTEGISPKGNETLRAVIGITGPDGTEYRIVKVMSATPLGALQLLLFARACDCEDHYHAGHIEPAMFIGRELIATVATQPKKGLYPARSVIVDFSPVADAVVTPLRSAGGDEQ
jgi:hypothetical protein